MIKLTPPTDVKIVYQPLVLCPSEEETDRMTRMQWHQAVIHARTVVGRALNRFFYGGK